MYIYNLSLPSPNTNTNLAIYCRTAGNNETGIARPGE